MATTLETTLAGSGVKKLGNGNGNVVLTRTLSWLLGVLVVGGGSFFATSYLQDIKDRLIKIEAKQDKMQEDIAELKASAKAKP